MKKYFRVLFLSVAVLSGALAFAQAYSPEQLTSRAVERRAVEAAIWGMPLVNVDYMRQAYFRAGAKYNDFIFWSNPNTWMNQTTTPNHSTSYVMFFLDLKNGPVVVDIPAAGDQAVYGTLITAWNANGDIPHFQTPNGDIPHFQFRTTAACLSCRSSSD